MPHGVGTQQGSIVTGDQLYQTRAYERFLVVHRVNVGIRTLLLNEFGLYVNFESHSDEQVVEHRCKVVAIGAHGELLATRLFAYKVSVFINNPTFVYTLYLDGVESSACAIPYTLTEEACRNLIKDIFSQLSSKICELCSLQPRESDQGVSALRKIAHVEKRHDAELLRLCYEDGTESIEYVKKEDVAMYAPGRYVFVDSTGQKTFYDQNSIH